MSRPKKPVEVITKAKPHTIKKFELIESYVDEWARKLLAFDGCNGIVYVDCMSNSGLYYDIEGNLVEGTALRVAKKLNAIIKNYPNKKAFVYFNDIEPERTNKLQEEIEKIGYLEIGVEISTQDGNSYLRKFNLHKYKNYNTLLVYDPYRATIDWDAVSPFLNRWGEVIINHMVSDTLRGVSLAKNENVIQKYQKTYQQEISEIISVGNDKQKLDEIIVKLIEDATSEAKQKHFIASFPFFNRTNGLVYNLIHCCSNIAGLKLYKKVAWQTFEGKSSLKNTHGIENQFMMDLCGSGEIETTIDHNCYYIKDVATYIYDKYHLKGKVEIDLIYNDLDHHPIFPSDGFKNEIKKELKNIYSVSFPHGYVVFEKNKENTNGNY